MAKVELKAARRKISELEEVIKESRCESQHSEPSIENMEEVKKEITIDNLTEIAEKLKCDYSNPDELKSLQLALQLEAEERQKVVTQNEQARHFRLMRENDENSEQIDPDNMTYEQLLELEEKIGSVSKGLPKEEIMVKKYKLILIIANSISRIS